MVEADEGDRPFNSLVMLPISGAANTGIDNKGVHGVFRFEFPPSIEDCIQEEGMAGRRNGADHTTDWYCICISLESFLSVSRRVLTSTSKDSNHKASLVSDLHIAMSILVLPTHCLQLIFSHKSANPFYFVTPPLPPPCMIPGSFYLGQYGDMFPILRREGVISVLSDLFLGENRIDQRPIIKSVLLNEIVVYPSSH